MESQAVRVGKLTKQEREIINLLTPEQRKEILLAAAKKKYLELGKLIKEVENVD